MSVTESPPAVRSCVSRWNVFSPSGVAGGSVVSVVSGALAM